MRLSDRNKILGNILIIFAIISAIYYVLCVFWSPWMTPEVINILHLPKKENGVWFAACIMATLLTVIITTLGTWLICYASSSGHVPPPSIKKL